MVEYLIMLITLMFIWYRGNISLRFSSNSEASTSELLENLEEMFLVATPVMPVSERSNIQSHNSVLTIVKELINSCHDIIC